jgi:ribonuclease M5
MELGLSGGADASAKRLALLKKLDLPQHMSANAMLQALNLLYDIQELKKIMIELEG